MDIIELYEKYGNSDYIGEIITQTEHALQSALLAEKYKPNDEEFIVAALLHDIGHIIPNGIKMSDLGILEHEHEGAAYLKKYGFSERILYLISNHVNAKRYLISVSGEYMEKISDASRKTLKYQGGPMRPDEIENFKKHKYFEDVILLRNIDEAAKEKGAPTRNFIEYLELIKKLICQSTS